MTAYFFSAVSVLVGSVALKKLFVRNAALSVNERDHLTGIFCVQERIRSDILIHSPAAFILLPVVGKQDDFFACIGKVVKYAGIIRDQSIAQTEPFISVPLGGKGTDMAVSFKSLASVEKRVKLHQKDLSVAELAVPEPEMTGQRIHVILTVHISDQAPEGRKISDQPFAFQSCFFKKAFIRRAAEYIVSGISLPEYGAPVKTGEHISAGHFFFHKRIGKYKIIRIQKIPQDVPHADGFRTVVPAHFLQGRSMPGVQIDLPFFFYEASRESGVVYQITCLT